MSQTAERLPVSWRSDPQHESDVGAMSRVSACVAGDVAEGGVEATPDDDAKTASNAVSTSAPSNAAALPVVGDSKLRRSVAFTWKDVMVSSPVGESTAQDAIFELASVLEAVALWKMARAATLCADARFGIGGDAVSKVRHDVLASSTYQHHRLGYDDDP